MDRVVRLWDKLIVLVVFILIASLFSTILIHDGLPLGHDIFAHITYGKLFTEALRQGQFPVRWTEGVTPGFSQPLFNFYQVGFYYLIALINIFFQNFLLSVKMAIVLLWGTGTFFTFLFAKKFGLLPATMAALIYATSPYLLLDIFVRASYPEFMAISFIPPTFWAIDQVASKNSPIYLSFVAIFFSIVIFSHLPAMMIFFPIALGYIVLKVLLKEINYKKAIHILFGFLLGAGIASFYFLPAIFELDKININLLTSQDFDYKQNFINPYNIFSYIWGYNSQTTELTSPKPFNLGVFQWLITVTAIISFSAFKSKRIILTAVFWICSITLSYLMSSYGSHLIWKEIRILNFVQFPWRFFMITPISFALLGAVILSRVQSANHQIGLIMIALVLTMYSSFQNLPFKQFIEVGYFNLEFNEWRAHPSTLQNAYWEPAYNPKGENSLPPKNLPVATIKEGDGKIKELVNYFHYKTFWVESSSSMSLVVNTRLFSGWKGYVKGQEIKLFPVTDNQFIGITAPEGNYILELKFGDEPIRSFANAASIISLLTTLSIIFFPVAKRLSRVALQARTWIFGKNTRQ